MLYVTIYCVHDTVSYPVGWSPNISYPCSSGYNGCSEFDNVKVPMMGTQSHLDPNVSPSTLTSLTLSDLWCLVAWWWGEETSGGSSDEHRRPKNGRVIIMSCCGRYPFRPFFFTFVHDYFQYLAEGGSAGWLQVLLPAEVEVVGLQDAARQTHTLTHNVVFLQPAGRHSQVKLPVLIKPLV